jgi:Xaa-Pro dipeptidase
MNAIHEQRFIETKKAMNSKNIDCLVLCNSPNLYYLTGYSPKKDERLQIAFITADGKSVMVVPMLYSMNAEKNCNIKDQRIWRDGDNLYSFIDKIADELGIKGGRIGIDSIMEFMQFDTILKSSVKSEFINANSVFKQLRMKKSPEEIELMAQSAKLSDDVMDMCIKACLDGKTEAQIKNLVEYELTDKGMAGGFSNLIASGPNSSSPHHVSGDRIPQKGDCIYLDLGGAYKKYWSDITRTIHFGNPSDKFIKNYEYVKEAQRLAKEAVKPGVSANDVHMTAVKYFEKKGVNEYYLHRTGHGIGLEGHEDPYIAKGNDLILEEGMTFSIEPGLYYKNEFGIRIEDIVVVTKDGHKTLNHFDRELIII